MKRPDQVCESCCPVLAGHRRFPATEIACHHNKVLARHADTHEWTYQHRVARKRPTQKQSEQLAKTFDQAGPPTDGGKRRNWDSPVYPDTERGSVLGWNQPVTYRTPNMPPIRKSAPTMRVRTLNARQ